MCLSKTAKQQSDNSEQNPNAEVEIELARPLSNAISSSDYEVLYEKRFDKELSIEDKKKILNYQVYHRAGYNVDFENPKTFNEKLQWLKLYYHNSLLTNCADKVKAREYFLERMPHGQQHLVPSLGFYDTFEDIDFTSFPNSFVLKSNWGSYNHIIITDKNEMDYAKCKKIANSWMEANNNLYYRHFEWAYKNIIPQIVAEELIDFKYKIEFFCFNGKPEFLWVVFDDKTKQVTADFYNLEWDLLQMEHGYKMSPYPNIPKPNQLEKLIENATLLANNLPFVRVDFYLTEDSYYFSEMTFYPRNGACPFTPEHYDLEFGNLLTLPGEKNIESKTLDLTPYNAEFYRPVQDKAYTSAKIILELIKSSYDFKSLVDLGCGIGTWLKAAQDLGVETIQGYDANQVEEKHLFVPRKNIEIVNLNSLHISSNEKFDLAMSLEVAEHLQESSSKNFVNTLTNLSDIILFSAAIPLQPGTQHINCKPLKFWVDLFEQNNFVCFDFIRKEIMDLDEIISYWYIQNILLFVHENKKEIFLSKGYKEIKNPLMFYHWQFVEYITDKSVK